VLYRLVLFPVTLSNLTTPNHPIFDIFKFWWAPAISLERLIVSGAVNLGGRQCGKLVTVTLSQQIAH